MKKPEIKLGRETKPGKHILSKDGKQLHEGTEFDCYLKLQRIQSNSADWAMKYEGYKIEPKPKRKSPRKMESEYEIQGNYFGRWEMVTTEATRAKAKVQLKCYDENERGTAHRIIHRRVPVKD